MTQQAYYLHKLEDWTIKCDQPVKLIFERLQEGKYIFTVKRVFNKRSNDQNAYFHWVVVPMLAEHMGMVIPGLEWEETTILLGATKEYIINHYCPKVSVKNQKDKRKRITFQKRTSDLDTKEFKVMIDRILKDYPFIPPPENGEIKSLIEFYESMYWPTKDLPRPNLN